MEVVPDLKAQSPSVPPVATSNHSALPLHCTLTSPRPPLVIPHPSHPPLPFLVPPVSSGEQYRLVRNDSYSASSKYLRYYSETL